MTMTFNSRSIDIILSVSVIVRGRHFVSCQTTFPKQLGHKCIVIYDQQQHHIHQLIVHITDYIEHKILFIWSRY